MRIIIIALWSLSAIIVATTLDLFKGESNTIAQDEILFIESLPDRNFHEEVDAATGAILL